MLLPTAHSRHFASCLCLRVDRPNRTICSGFMTNSSFMGGVGDVAASHHAALSRSQAVLSGLTPQQIRTELGRSTLRPLAPRVYGIHGAPPTWRQSLMAATLTANGAGVVSHRAAAQLHAVDGFTDDVREVIVARGRRVRMPGVVAHQAVLASRHWLLVDGIPCTSLARTLVDLRQVCTEAEVIRAIDSFQRMGFSLTWLEQVATELHRPGQRGTKFVLAQVCERRASGAVPGSWMERLIAAAIASPRLPALVLQHNIHAADGSFLARVDLAIPSVRLGIEAHSRSFHAGTHQEVVDQRRENRAIEEGWQFLYLGWADRKTPAQARAFLERVVARRFSDLQLDAAELTRTK